MTPGILHFGVGIFTERIRRIIQYVLADADQQNWGICGAMILDKDEDLFRRLKKQDGCFGLTVFGRTGQDEYYWIGSLVDLLWGVENPAAVIDKVADPCIKIITLTITEGGYNLDKKTRDLIFPTRTLFMILVPESPDSLRDMLRARKRMAGETQADHNPFVRQFTA